jgi:hypothetical protein
MSRKNRHNHKSRNQRGDAGFVVRCRKGLLWVVIQDLPLGQGFEVGTHIKSANAARMLDNGTVLWRRTSYIKGYEVVRKYDGVLQLPEEKEPREDGSGFGGRDCGYLAGVVD